MSEVITLPVIRIERHPDPQRERAERIVAQWLVELWATRPDCLIKMPSAKETTRLIDLITAELPGAAR